MSMNFEQARAVMVEQQVRPWEVLDARVLETIATVPRELFVPEAQRQLAYVDMPLPLAHGEIMMKPVLEGRLLQALALEAEDEVLEIGTGSGYVTACLARLAREVVSLDLHADFLHSAGERLQQSGIRNVRLQLADALGFKPDRQFDAVAVTAAVAELPEIFSTWLKPGGRMFVIRGLSPVQQALRVTRRGDALHNESLFETDVPYLRGAEPVAQFTL